jgi:ubiquinone/menaquinone biosynthesis C-methylase UbiE
VDAAGLGVEGIQFVQADILEWTPPSREFDLVATHFVLDCFRGEQLEELAGCLAGC